MFMNTTQHYYGLETFCTLIVLSSSTTRNLFNHNVRTIFFFKLKVMQFSKKKNFLHCGSQGIYPTTPRCCTPGSSQNRKPDFE